MNKIKVLVFVIIAILAGCSSEKTCDVSNPLSDLSWLDQKVQAFKQDDIKQRVSHYIYNNEDVYLVEDCLEICADFLTIAYNCAGETVCEFGGIDGRNTCPDFEEKASLQATIYDE
jgi:hypothetical protein